MITFSEGGHSEIFKAFIAAQSEMDGAKKNASNPAFKSKYADLAAVCDAVMEALTKHKIGVVQSPTFDENGVHVQTMLIHESGQYMYSTLSMRPEKLTPQGLGSCITYARRYALSAICGVAPEDDDGNAASGMTGAKAPEQKTPNSAQAKREGTWEMVEEKLRSAETEEELDKRAKWFLANGKIPHGWKQQFDDEWERCRNDLIEKQGASNEHALRNE